MKRVLFVSLFLLLCGSAFAGGFGVQADYNNFVGDEDIFENLDGGDFGLGARVEAGSSLGFILSFDYYFVGGDIGDTKFYEGNANLAFWFPTGGVRPYLGGGVGFARTTFKLEDLFDQSNTETGINILGGIKFSGPVNPFVEVRYVIYTGDESFANRLVFTGGIVF
jgi:hypothetical protein